MECGFKNWSAAGGLISDLRGVSEKDFILLNPLFQPSNIPSFQGIFLRQSRSPLTWLREPGFLNLNTPHGLECLDHLSLFRYAYLTKQEKKPTSPASVSVYSGCQKNVAFQERFFTTAYITLTVFRNLFFFRSGIKSNFLHQPARGGRKEA